MFLGPLRDQRILSFYEVNMIFLALYIFEMLNTR